MTKDAVKVKTEQDSKSGYPISCDLCEGLNRFSECSKVARCKKKIRQALTKNAIGDSTKEPQSNASMLSIISKNIAVLTEVIVAGEGECK